MSTEAILPLSLPGSGGSLARAPRRFTGRRRTQLAVVAIVVALLAAGGMAIRDEFSRPSMIEVAQATLRPPTIAATDAARRSVDGIRFPNWTRWGWTATGGRVDRVEDGRTISTTTYAKGSERIAVSIVSGTGWVDDDAMWGTSTAVLRGAHQVEVREWTGAVTPSERPAPTAGGPSTTDVAVLRRQVQGHTMVLTGTPAGPALTLDMRRLALRDVDKWNAAR
jgi:hypothetical protein